LVNELLYKSPQMARIATEIIQRKLVSKVNFLSRQGGRH
jgi:hypothetical protein